MRRLYELLRDRGDNFYHWMTSMYDIGASDYDPSLSAFETDDTTWTATADPGGTLAETP